MMDTFPDFAWAVGEEGSDPIVLSDGRPHRHDQYAQSGHYDHMDDDLRAVAELGIGVIRYGMPWRLTEPEPGRYDWTVWDRALAACAIAEVEPVIDLLHFGLPDHWPRFADPRWIDAFVRYVDAFLARYPAVRWFTPVNEPGMTATFTARYGLWNDRLHSQADYFRVLAHCVLANLEALDRIHVDRSAMWIGSEGFTAWTEHRPSDRATITERRDLSRIVWDLHLGHDVPVSVAGALDAVDPEVLHRIRTLARHDDLVAGHDVYPVSVTALDGTTPDLAQITRAAAEELRSWYERYQVPIWIAETSNLGLPVSQQSDWLHALVAVVDELRGDGIAVRGICWYSRGDQYDWQTALAEPTGAITEVGLFDERRRARPVVEDFAELARRPARPIGSATTARSAPGPS